MPMNPEIALYVQERPTMNETQGKLEKWAMDLQAANEASDAAFEVWFARQFHDYLPPQLRQVALESWRESRRQTLLEHAPRIMLASEIAALIHKLDALQPKQ